MKKKILALALVVVLAVTAVTGATLAYFTDKDAQSNVFTTGNVKIDLYEDFGDNNDKTIEKLMPVTYDENGKRKDDNVIEKEVYVTNTGSEPAYVRVHIAIPTILDNGDPSFDASKNVLHFNFDNEDAAEGKWDWSDKTGAPYTGEWNFYTETIDEIEYNVYVVTYETALKKGDTTVDAISQVYLDKKVTNEDITKINDKLGVNWKILVAAEGAQQEGFADAYEALNTSFGKPGEYDVTWTAPADAGLTWVDVA